MRGMPMYAGQAASNRSRVEHRKHEPMLEQHNLADPLLTLLPDGQIGGGAGAEKPVPCTHG